jgi:hypothetical protein
VAATAHPARTMSRAQLDAMFALEQKVLDLRTTGKSFYRINKTLGIQNSHQVFQRAIARDDNAQYRRDEALRLEEARLDALQEGIWGRAVAGDPRAVEVAIKVLERRARLLGLDFADLVSGRLVEVEESRVVLVATALAAALRDNAVPQETSDAVVARFLEGVRRPVTIPSTVVQPDEDLL